MKTVHIVPRRLGPAVADYIFGACAGSLLNTADNYLIVYISVEANFDHGNFVLLPADFLNHKSKHGKSKRRILRLKNQIWELGQLLLVR